MCTQLSRGSLPISAIIAAQRLMSARIAKIPHDGCISPSAVLYASVTPRLKSPDGNTSSQYIPSAAPVSTIALYHTTAQSE